MTPATDTTGDGRRTQQQRRDATKARLVDACVSSLCEIGYQRSTISEICGRSGVSQGGLFRHFPTRLDLVIAAADEVRRRQFEAFSQSLAMLGTDTLADCLLLVRAACRAPVNGAWYELLVAARTDAGLRERLAPMLAEYHTQIADFARMIPSVQGLPPGQIEVVALTVVHLFDGESVAAAVNPQPALDDARLELVLGWLAGLAG
ncbi:TetR/AcrR family transcriptional regulator [Williamsia soli]|uniref:TetR/AcrR family transcriptional regulator n=1 Tax=Williamsia soli TaxID=364929 RepID=UPI001A9D6FF1|nr:TetR/AcrR family transcriptional regulator [Williamsia soli]